MLSHRPDDVFKLEASAVRVWRSTTTCRSRIQLRDADQINISGYQFQLDIRRQCTAIQTTIIDMESDHDSLSTGGRVNEVEPEMITIPVQTPKGKAGKELVIEETPAHNEFSLIGIVARDAYQLSQGSQQEPEDPIKAAVMKLIKDTGSQASRSPTPNPIAMPRAFAAIANLDTAEAIDSQESTIRHADTLLRSAGPFAPSSPPDWQLAAEKERQVDADGPPILSQDESRLDAQIANDTDKGTKTAAVHQVYDAEDVLDHSESLPNAKSRNNDSISGEGDLPHVKSIKVSRTPVLRAAVDGGLQVGADDTSAQSPVNLPSESRIANDTVDGTPTGVSNSIDNAEDVQDDSESLPNAKRRKKGSTSEQGQPPLAKAIKKSGPRKKKMNNSLSRADHQSSQESWGSTIQVQMNPPSQHFTGDGAPKLSPVDSRKDPTSSNSSHQTRSQSKGASPAIDRVASHEIRVLFGSTTDVYNMDNFKKSLQNLGLRKAFNVDDCDYLCVGKGELKKTAKVISAIASGKPVVFDAWAKESAKQKELLDPTPYLASHAKHKKEWGITLAEAIELGKQGLKPFGEYVVCITSALKQQLGSAFQEIKQIAEIGGAAKVLGRAPTGRDDRSTTLVVATDDDPKLVQLVQEGWRCYCKDLITISVLRSALDLESDEFLIGAGADVGDGGRGSRGTKRKR